MKRLFAYSWLIVTIIRCRSARFLSIRLRIYFEIKSILIIVKQIIDILKITIFIQLFKKF